MKNDEILNLYLGVLNRGLRGGSNLSPFRVARILEESPCVTAGFVDIETGDIVKPNDGYYHYRIAVRRDHMLEKILSGTLTNTPRSQIGDSDEVFAAGWDPVIGIWRIIRCSYVEFLDREKSSWWKNVDPKTVSMVAMSHSMKLLV